MQGERFFSFKARVIDLTKVVQGHFNKLIRDIMDGLPSVAEADDEEGIDYTFDGTNTTTLWTCRTCMVKN